MVKIKAYIHQLWHKLKNRLAAILIWLKNKIKNKPKINKQQVFATIITLIAIVALIQNYLLLSAKNNQDITTQTNKTKTVKTGVLTKDTPKFKTILPAGKTIQSLGGWTRVSPSSADPVFAFVDYIGKSPINLSQQPLPDSFKTDTDQQVADLASDFNASEKITVGSINVYIGTSVKGPQSVIFAKNNLLILIKSSVKINNDKWAEYINNLN